VTSVGSGLVDWAEAALPAMLDDLERLIGLESPSTDLDAVARSAELVASIGVARLGTEPERIVIDGRTHLRWRLGSTSETAPRILVLCHHDTVWPIGSLATHPFAVADGVLRGPGCFDMLTGLVMALHGVAALPELGDAAVTLLVTGDEELGSPSSRALIEEEAQGCLAAFVLEASADGGALKIGRKGASLYEVELVGRAAHAGLEPEKGINATVELAHQILAVTALADVARGTTVTPTVAQGGTTTNTMAARATFSIDARALTVAEQERVDAGIRSLASVTGCEITVHGGINRPPMEVALAQDLWQRALVVADRLGVSLPDPAIVGGASDGNFTAGMGIPTLDGLGAVGGGAHADTEHVLVGEIPPRTALLVGLMRDVLQGAGRSA
jgi:glutamate carboxypeptidase